MLFSLSEYLRKESNLKTLNSYTVLGNIPIWRIVRFNIRSQYVNELHKTINPKISFHLIVNLLLSLYQLIWIVIRRKHYENIIFPHPRLYLVNDNYLERLSDPLIEFSKIKSSYIIFERWQNGEHHKPRMHSKNCKYWDIIPFASLMMSKIFGNFIVRKYKSQIKGLLSELNEEFEVTKSTEGLIIRELSNFLISYHLSAPILKACKPKRIFMAPRSTFDYIIVYAKKHGIKTYELQHGITLGATKLYSGEYNEEIDPDYFLTFGEGNISNHFGIPVEKIKNMGFAYGNYLAELTKNNANHNSQRIIVISDPQITDQLLSIVKILATEYTDWTFDFRCHPQEALNKDQKELIESIPNIVEVSNKEESFATLNKYPIVIGENSSVLFEALFLKKRVGRLNFNGLKVRTDSKIQGGYVVNSVEDFKVLVEDENLSIPNPQQLYSEFNPDIVNNLE